MNKIFQENYPLFAMYQALRNQLMEILSDADLTFQLAGDNKTLGVLCREIGEVQTSYIRSFKTLTQDFDYRNEEPGLEGSVTKLSSWFQALDEELKETIAAFTDEEIETKRIDRGHGFILPILFQLEVYKEALLIFYGKVSVYLRAMEKARPEQWQEWIG